MNGTARFVRHPVAFIFDLDGTLIDSAADIAAATNAARAQFGLAELPLPVVKGYIGDGVQMLMRRVLSSAVQPGPSGEPGLPVTETMVAAGLAVLREYYGRHCLDRTVLYPGARELLNRLHGTPLMIATNKPRRFTEQILHGLAIDADFRRVITGDDVTHMKPHPEALERCLEGLTVAPCDVVVVGDSPNDIEAARALGAVAVAATYGMTSPEVLLAARPDHSIASIAELAELFTPG